MINSIRTVRRAKGLSLKQVAERCTPPTTAQTIGRLETGTRTLSLDWMARIAIALGVEAEELLHFPKDMQCNIVALLGYQGAHAPTQPETIRIERPNSTMLAVRVSASIGDYRAGDEIYCRPLHENWQQARNRDILLPRPAGRFLFGRLLNIESTEGTFENAEGKLHLLALDSTQRQYVVTNPPWIALATRLVRQL